MAEEPVKPESMLPKKIQEILEEALNKKLDEAIKGDNMDEAAELQRAKKLIHRGCWTVRNDNPYLYFMEQCLLNKGGTLKDTQETMRKCAENWKQLPTEKRREFEALAKGLAVYDYL